MPHADPDARKACNSRNQRKNLPSIKQKRHYDALLAHYDATSEQIERARRQAVDEGVPFDSDYAHAAGVPDFRQFNNGSREPHRNTLERNAVEAFPLDDNKKHFYQIKAPRKGDVPAPPEQNTGTQQEVDNTGTQQEVMWGEDYSFNVA